MTLSDSRIDELDDFKDDLTRQITSLDSDIGQLRNTLSKIREILMRRNETPGNQLYGLSNYINNLKSFTDKIDLIVEKLNTKVDNI